MNEPNDKPLHEWVRHTLDTYRPAYEPHGWQQMQRRLQRRRWWRRGVVGSLGVLALLLAYWFLLPATTSTSVYNQTYSKTKNQLAIPANRLDTETQQHQRILQLHNSIPKSHLIQRQRERSTPMLEPISFLPANIPSLPSHLSLETLSTNLTDLDHKRPLVAYNLEEEAIKHQMLTGDFGPDSTVYQTLDRNLRQWPNTIVVCDLTTSMYPYSSQLFAWLRQHTRQPAVKGIVFFTDCDSLGQQTRPDGPAGRMFVTREKEPLNALPTILAAARNTIHNKDDAENNIEALHYAQVQFPEAKHLILVADNMSRVKDLHRLGDITKPVHVILCGTTGGDLTQPFQPDYFTIASRTNGSLHTIEDDLTPGKLSGQTILHVGSHYYRYQRGKKRFRFTSFNHRPIRIMGLFWL